MAEEWTALCKICGEKFGYSQDAFKNMLEKGHSRQERCPKCRAANTRAIQYSGLAYYPVKPTARAKDEPAPGVIGKLSHPPREHIKTRLKSKIEIYEPKFGVTQADISDLFKLLSRHQVVVVVGPTGSGKSTYLPYRLMVPPEGFDPNLFTRHGQIVVTQPRIQATRTIANFVASDLHGQSLGPGFDVGFRHSESPTSDGHCKLVYVTDGIMINWIASGRIADLSVIMIDEAHERSLNIDLIVALLKRQLPRFPHLKLIIASATIDAGKFIRFFGGETVVGFKEFEGKRDYGYGEPRFSDKLTELKDMPAATANKAVEVLKGMSSGDKDYPWGDVLAFLPGQAQIEEAISLIREHLFSSGLSAKVYPLHAKLLLEDQRAALNPEHKCTVCQKVYLGEPAECENGCSGTFVRMDSNPRIIVATNIAETSLTVEGIVHVIDSGLITRAEWDPAALSTSYLVKPHSQAGCMQRWGRAGRIQKGVAHCLYTKQLFENTEFDTPPEIARASLEQLALTAKAAGVADITSLEWLPPGPRSDELDRAQIALKTRGALDADGDITEHGLELRSLAEPPGLANLVVIADRFSVAIEMTTILPFLKLPLNIPLLLWDETWDGATRRAARLAHQALLSGVEDDLEFYLKLYTGWVEARNQKEWAEFFFVNEAVFSEKIEPQREAYLEGLAGHKKEKERRSIDFDLLDKARFVLAYCLPEYIFDLTGHSKTGPEYRARHARSWIATKSDTGEQESSATPKEECAGIHRNSILHPNWRSERTDWPHLVLFGKSTCLYEGKRAAPFVVRLNPWMIENMGDSLLPSIEAGKLIAQHTRRETGDLVNSGTKKRLFLDQWYWPRSHYICHIRQKNENGPAKVIIGDCMRTPPIFHPTSRTGGEEKAPVLPPEGTADGGLSPEIFAKQGSEPLCEAESDEMQFQWEAVDALENQEVDLTEDLPDEKSPDSEYTNESRVFLEPETKHGVLITRGVALSQDKTIRAQVVSYSTKEEPVVILHPLEEPDSFEKFCELHQVNDIVEVEAIETLVNTRDSLTSLLVKELTTGLEVVMEAEELFFTGDLKPLSTTGVGQIPIGTKFKVEVTKINKVGHRVSLSKMRFVEKSLSGLLQQGSVREARVLKITQKGVLFKLEHAKEGIIYVGYLSKSKLPPGVTPKPDSPIPVRFWQDKKTTHSKRLMTEPKGLDDLFTTKLTFNQLTNQIFIRGPMSFDDCRAICKMVDDFHFQRLVETLYQRSNWLKFEVIDKDVYAKFSKGQILEGLVVKIDPKYVLVKTDGGLVGIVLDARPQRNFSGEPVSPNKKVTVVVENVDHNKGRLLLGWHEEKAMEKPLKDTLLAYSKGQIVTGTVTGITDYGFFVTMPDSVSGLVHISQMGVTSEIHPSMVVRQGDQVKVKVIDIRPDRGKLTLRFLA